MATLKIPKVGDTVTFCVQKCEVVESTKFKDRQTGDWMQDVKFTAPNGDTLFIGRFTADQKLGRCGFGEKNPDGKTYDIHYGDVDGHTLRFYRDPNPNDPTKPYYGIDRVMGEDAPRHRPAGNAKQAESLGPSIPGLDDPQDDDGYLDSLAGAPDGFDPPAFQTAPTQGAAVPNKRQAIVEAYRDAVAAAWDIWGEGTPPDVVQSAAATILIALQKAGVV